MTPQTLLIDRSFKGVGRIKRATGTTVPKVRHAMSRMLTTLHHQGRLDLLRAVRDGQLSLLQVYDAFRRNAVEALPTSKTVAPLIKTMRSWIEKADYSDSHRESLGTSCDYIEKAAPHAIVNDLPAVLEALRDTLGAKYARSFNLCRSAAQAFVKATLKRSHPLWLAVAAVEPRKIVKQRAGRPFEVTEMCNYFPNPDTDKVDGIAWSMALHGMGQEEYWGRWHVAKDRVHIEGTKRRGRVRDVPMIWRPIPPPLYRTTFEKKFRVRVSHRFAVYDLRRTFAHWMEEAGIPRTRRNIYRGHGTKDVGDLYERHEVAAYIAQDAEKLRQIVSVPTKVHTVTRRNGLKVEGAR